MRSSRFESQFVSCSGRNYINESWIEAIMSKYSNYNFNLSFQNFFSQLHIPLVITHVQRRAEAKLD